MAETLQQQTQDLRSSRHRIAVLGWAAEAFEGLQAADTDFLAVVPPGFEASMDHAGIPYEVWDFERTNERAVELTEALRTRGVELAVPLYEETVEWAGALNATFRDNPRLFNRSLLFRDKAMMKRMAQMHGIRVGVFEEVNDRQDVSRFLQRVNKALLKLEGENPDPVHLKPMTGAGSLGHRIIRTEEDIHALPDDVFPLLAESNLDGQEFSCEAFIHDGEIYFLNITEYVHLGHSDFVPAGPDLEAHRERIRLEIEKLIEAFRIDHGMIHPEFFVTPDGKIRFGEVAYRVPGGHIFQKIQRAYGFDPYVGMVLCHDPSTDPETLREFFPPEDGHNGYSGVLMVHPPAGRNIERLNVPDEVLDDPFFERHTLVEPVPGKVAGQEGFGAHAGTVYFFGDDGRRMRDILLRYEQLEFFE